MNDRGEEAIKLYRAFAEASPDEKAEKERALMALINELAHECKLPPFKVLQGIKRRYIDRCNAERKRLGLPPESRGKED